MGPISAAQRYVIGGLGLVLILALAWGFRVDHLRGRYKSYLSSITTAIVDAGYDKPKMSELAVSVRDLDLKRKSALTERDHALMVVDNQSRSITKLEQETAEAAQRSAADRKLIAATIQQRDAWIKRAKAAETRTERLSAEEEVKECERILDELYQSGF